jgi:hypothetical protein
MKLKKYHKLIFYFTGIIVLIFLISVFMFPEISKNISRLLHLDIVPMGRPTITAMPMELGSGVNITDGTIIRLTGLNCNLTIVKNLTVDNMEVYPNYLLFNTSLRDLTYILNLPYNYSVEDKVLNITCGQSNTETTLSLDISDFGNGIKIYGVSEQSNLTSVDWSSSEQNFSFTVNAPSGITSSTRVYWPYSNQPDIIECTASSCNSNWDPITKILTLNATHSSPVKWTLHVQNGVTTTISSTTTTSTTTTTTVPVNTETRLYLNGTEGDFYYLNNTYANFSVSTNVSGTVYLSTNITDWTTRFGDSPLTRGIILNASQNNTYYNITGYFPGNATYNQSSQTHYAIVYVNDSTTTTTTTVEATTTVGGGGDGGVTTTVRISTTTTAASTTISQTTTTAGATTTESEETTTTIEEKPKGIQMWYLIPIIAVFVAIAIVLWYIIYLKKPAENTAFEQLKEKWKK